MIRHYFGGVVAWVVVTFIGAVGLRADVIYVSDITNNLVYSFSSVTGIGSIFASTGLNQPGGMAVDGAGNLYVQNVGSIEKFTPGGFGSVYATSGLLGSVPVSLTIDSLGNLYAVTKDSGELVTIKTDGTVSHVSVRANLDGLAFDGSGTLYGTDELADNIVSISASGQVSSVITTGLNDPFGLVFDASGNMYVADHFDSTILKFAPDLTESVFDATGLSGPRGPVFDSAGNLYVTNGGSRTVEKIAPDGTPTLFASFNTTSLGFIAVGPDITVPEPSSIVLLGVGMVGLIRRRR